MLDKARLGRTNLEIVRLGMGSGYGLTEEGYRHAIDLGINYVDTARSYEEGRCEGIIARAIKGRREELVLTTKTLKRSAKEAEEELNTSLRELGVDCVDICHIHALDKQEELEQALSPGGALEALKKAQEQGKVRFIAASSHSWEQMGRNLATGLFDSCLVWYNCAELEPERLVFPVAEEQDAGVVIMKATGWGKLLDPSPGWEGPVPKATDLYRFVLSHPAVDVVLFSGTDGEKIREAADAVEDFQPFSEEEMQWLKAYGKACREAGRLEG